MKWPKRTCNGVEAKTFGEWLVRYDGSLHSGSEREDDGEELEIRVRCTVILSNDGAGHMWGV